MTDTSPILSNEQRMTSIKLRQHAENQARSAYERYQRSLRAINEEYKRKMKQAGLQVLLEEKKP